MSQTERINKIHRLLQNRGVVPRQTFLDELEVSLATLKRDIAFMRDRLNAPIEWDAERQGYRFAEHQGVGDPYSLPGLWFTATEVTALLTMQQLVRELDGGLLSSQVTPLLKRLNQILESESVPVEEIGKRIRILRSGARQMDPEHFQQVASAVLNRKRLKIKHYNRGSNVETEREISPQRLVNYRRNWYVDSWCHLRKDIRSFALDAIRDATPLETKAIEVADDKLNAVLASGYGIFGGENVEWATIRFSPTAARWVASEIWHKLQRSRFESDGSYVLEVPYSNRRELIMDVMRYGVEAEVLGPLDLRNEISTLVKRLFDACQLREKPPA
ncbi:MAG: helix-turn-helix transcriptional regulator [Burkholderiales bacterium]